MILADTSVWIEYFNGKNNEHTDLLDNALADGLVVIGDIIFLEILQGFRDDNHYKQARLTLGTLDHYQMLGTEMVVQCAENYRSLRKRGITIRRTTDVVIATFCIKNKFPLLFQDRDFNPFVEHLKLKAAI